MWEYEVRSHGLRPKRGTIKGIGFHLGCNHCVSSQGHPIQHLLKQGFHDAGSGWSVGSLFFPFGTILLAKPSALRVLPLVSRWTAGNRAVTESTYDRLSLHLGHRGEVLRVNPSSRRSLRVYTFPTKKSSLYILLVTHLEYIGIPGLSEKVLTDLCREKKLPIWFDLCLFKALGWLLAGWRAGQGYYWHSLRLLKVPPGCANSLSGRWLGWAAPPCWEE